jgi:hypothetical protein
MQDLLNNYREGLTEISSHASNPRYLLAKGLLDKCFLTWIASNKDTVTSLIKDVKAGKLTA